MTDFDTAFFERLEHFYDAVPRDSTRQEEFGGLVLFVREGAGWPFYARPRLDAAAPPTVADIAAARARQQELGIPQAFEWVHETTPDLLETARTAGLSVLLAPLLVLDPAALPPAGELPGMSVRVLDSSAASFAEDIAQYRAVARVAFGSPAEVGAAHGPAERDTVRTDLPEEQVTNERERTESGRRIAAVAESATEGVLAGGVVQRVGAVAEIAGVATLPSARRRGLAGAVTAELARQSRGAGVELVFLSAGSEATARVYQRIGFRRVGTACIAEPAEESRDVG